MSNQRIGLKAELAVASILPGSVIVNEEKEQRKPYDLIWQDVKIDVKGTEHTVSKKACTFTANLSPAHSGIILVLLAMIDGQNYFWVEHYKNRLSLYKKFADAISPDQVPAEILKAANKPLEILDGLQGYTQLKLKEDYRERLAKLAVQENRSMANMVEVLIDQAIALKEKGGTPM